jgi:hypothetical protein
MRLGPAVSTVEVRIEEEGEIDAAGGGTNKTIRPY